MLPTFRNTTLQTRIKRITRKQRQQLRLSFELLIAPIIITQRLESRYSAYGFRAAWLDVIDIIIALTVVSSSGRCLMIILSLNEAEIRRTLALGRVGYAF